MKLKLGRYYVSRDGRIGGPLRRNTGIFNQPYMIVWSDERRSYNVDGTFFERNQLFELSHHDLVADAGKLGRALLEG